MQGPAGAHACLRPIGADVPRGGRYFGDEGCGPTAQRQMLADAESALGTRARIRANLPAAVLTTVARGLEVFGRVANRPVMLTREKASMLLMHWVCSSESTRRELAWEPRVK